MTAPALYIITICLGKLFRKQIKPKKIVDVDPVKFREMKAVSSPLQLEQHRFNNPS